MRLGERFAGEAGDRKAYVSGTHRACTPDETWARIAPRFGEFGITRVADVTRLDRLGVPVAMAIRPNARSLSVSQGKGATWAEARVSAAMEAIECWHAERFDEPGVIAGYAEIRERGAVIEPRRLPLRAGTVFHDRLPIAWVEGWDLMANEPTWVPRELVALDMLVERVDRVSCFPVTTNGLASGNTLTEATLHALYELIERDATSLWVCRQIRGTSHETRVDPGSVDHPVSRAIIARFVEQGFEIALHDETTDLGVPSFGCRIFERDPVSWDHPLGGAGGAGCHLDPGVALLRALTEAAQSRLTFITGSRDDLSRRHFQDLRPLRRTHATAPPPEFQLPTPLSFQARRSLATESLAGDLGALRARLAAIGVDRIVVVDLGRSSQGFSVVRVVAPDLEHVGDNAGLRRVGPRARRVLDGDQRPSQ